MATSATVQRVRRRPYTHLACQHCKDKHLKCDGTKPQCNACRAKGYNCVYRDERNKKRESSERVEETLRSVAHKFQERAEKWKTKYLALKSMVGQGDSYHRVADLSSDDEEIDLSAIIKQEDPYSGSGKSVKRHKSSSNAVNRPSGGRWTWAGGSTEEFFHQQGIQPPMFPVPPTVPTPSYPLTPSEHESSSEYYYSSESVDEYRGHAFVDQTHPMLHEHQRHLSIPPMSFHQQVNGTPSMIHIPRNKGSSSPRVITSTTSSGRVIKRMARPVASVTDQSSRQRRAHSLEDQIRPKDLSFDGMYGHGDNGAYHTLPLDPSQRFNAIPFSFDAAMSAHDSPMDASDEHIYNHSSEFGQHQNFSAEDQMVVESSEPKHWTNYNQYHVNHQ